MSCPAKFASPIAHNHLRGTCPITGHSHEFCPPQKGDVRSPCPALNTLANHGYLPRNGKSITLSNFVRALQQGYRLTGFLAWFLSIGTFLLLRQFGAISLSDLARHNHIEHDASLVHDNAGLEDEYAPCQIDEGLVEALMNDASNGLMSAECIARARVRREGASPPLDSMHAEIARGEMAIALRVFNANDGRDGIPLQWLREWIQSEHMPSGWRPVRQVGMIEVLKMSFRIRTAMTDMYNTQDKEQEVEAIKERIEVVEESESEEEGSTEGSSLFSPTLDDKETPPTSEEEEEYSEHEK